MLYFVDTTRRDARKVIASLRTVDREEAARLHGINNDDEMVDLVLAHPSFTIKAGSAPVGLFGALTWGGGWAAPWLIGTDALTACSTEFARASHPVFDQLVRPFDYITNAMLAKNVLHARWVKWMVPWAAWEEDTTHGVRIVRFTACVYQQQRPHRRY